MGLYVHIPFCETKCPYCDFNTYSGIEALIPVYVDALCEEARRWAALIPGREAATVFFGGGTPSYIPAGDLRRVMEALSDGFPLVDGAEVTMEVNPGDATPERAETWLSAGFNRVSMGVQSFDDRLLTLLGRRHNAAQAVESFRLLGGAGFENRSLDLMFGLPEQSLAQWQDSLNQAMALEPDHVSLYGLQLEGGTPLEADVRLGRTARPDDDLAADMYLAAEETLSAAGFRHYEISNWALPGRESRHNLIYWENGPYLGLGPGAHSSLFGYRFADMRSPRWYIRSLGIDPGVAGVTGAASKLALAGSPPRRAELPEVLPDVLRNMVNDGPVDFVEETTPQLELAETMMMGLRLDVGVSEKAFRERFGRSLRDVFATEIDALSNEGLLEADKTGIRLSPAGRLLGNEVFGRFVAAAEDS
ncbi:MAG: radical SAM family heme chaperone HemW [Chloroflexi bacterium]|nr:radical SAM family heme chaperone HemW [Chloroflexota bacterium]